MAMPLLFHIAPELVSKNIQQHAFKKQAKSAILHPFIYKQVENAMSCWEAGVGFERGEGGAGVGGSGG